MFAFELLKLVKGVADSVQAALKRIANRVLASLKDNGLQFANSVHRALPDVHLTFEKLKINIVKLILVRNRALSKSLSIMLLLDCQKRSYLDCVSLEALDICKRGSVLKRG
jgi:hypothetical protein